MNPVRINILAIIISGGLFVTGCQTCRNGQAVSGSRSEMAASPPPTPIQENIRTAPGTASVWTEGYWAHYEGNWVWVPEHFQAPPRSNAVWAPGRWDKVGRNWEWTPGHWN